MRATPVLALKIGIDVPPPRSGGAAGRPQLVTLRLTAEGAPGSEARVKLDGLLIQAAPEPARTPGVTVLPPEWQIVNEPLTAPEPKLVKPGAPVDVALTVTLPAAGAAVWIRSVLDGNVDLVAPGEGAPDRVRFNLSSKPTLIKPRQDRRP